MKLVKLTKALGIAKEFASKNSPSILTGFGVFGVCVTVVLTVRATKRSCDILQGCTDESGEPEVLTKTQVVSKCWKEYVPVAAMGAASIGCIVGSHMISLKRQAALMSLYSMTETALKKFEGEEKQKKSLHKFIEQASDEEPCNAKDQGDVLCFDSYSGRTFYSSTAKIYRSVDEFNRQLIGDLYCMLNDFYYSLGIDGIGAGEEVGWCIEHPLKVNLSADLTSDGRPILVMTFNDEPTKRYTM